MVGRRSTLQSRVTVAVGYGGLPPSLDRFQAGRLGYIAGMTRKMWRGDGEKEARRNIHCIRSVGRITQYGSTVYIGMALVW